MSEATMTPDDLATLERAVAALERPSFAARASNVLGRQLANAGKLLPAPVSAVVTRVSGAALRTAMHMALASLRYGPAPAGLETRHFNRALAAASGAVGGAFGLASLPIELPVSTTLMLRAIADVAESEGENLGRPEAALACLEVFALGGASGGPGATSGADLTESGYFAMRGLLARSISEAATYLAQRSVVDEAAPVLLRLVSQIAGRFGVVVSQKLAAQAVPAIGAFGGAAVNLAFTQHFQSLARGHFSVRRLERAYSPQLVRAEYERIAARLRETPEPAPAPAPPS
jgi:hypothetical protein